MANYWLVKSEPSCYSIDDFARDGALVDVFICAVDRCLYEAKRGGRAHVVVAEPIITACS